MVRIWHKIACISVLSVQINPISILSIFYQFLWEHYRQASGWYGISNFLIAESVCFPVCVCEKYQPGPTALPSAKSPLAHWVISISTGSKPGNILRFAISHFLCLYTVQDAVHGCPKGLADYNQNSILLFSLANVYHYPPLVIMAKSQPRLYFKYNGSLREGTDAAWAKAELFLLFSVIRKQYLRPCSSRFLPSWRLSCHASTCGNVPVMLV